MTRISHHIAIWSGSICAKELGAIATVELRWIWGRRIKHSNNWSHL